MVWLYTFQTIGEKYIYSTHIEEAGRNRRNKRPEEYNRHVGLDPVQSVVAKHQETTERKMLLDQSKLIATIKEYFLGKYRKIT